MKTDLVTPLETPETSAEKTSGVNDPFAVDFFAAGHAPSVDESLAPGNQLLNAAINAVVTKWNTRLPQFTREQWRLSAQLSVWPPSLSIHALDSLARIIARYTNVAFDEVGVEIVDLREANFIEDEPSQWTSPRVFVSLAVEPDTAARVCLELDAGFAASVIDRMLGGDGATPGELRPLSRIERAVFEFLWLNLTSELNESINEPLWRLDAVTSKPLAWLTAKPEATDRTGAPEKTPNNLRRGFVAAARVRIASTSGLVRLYFTPDAIRVLDVARNPLLWRERKASEKQKRFQKLALDLPLRLMIGETNVSANELAQLEPGDVVIVARPLADLRDKRTSNRLEVCVGAGRNAVIAGTIEATAAATATQPDGDVEAKETRRATMALRVEKISIENAPVATERLTMEEEKNVEEAAAVAEESGADDLESGVALDALLVTLHVELAARRISLEELSRLRAGQLLDLGCTAIDPVDLMSEGRRVARGELIDIEGRLGLRVTQVMD